MMPAQLVPIQKCPRLTTGKIDRNSLPAPPACDHGKIDRNSLPAPPARDHEEAVRVRGSNAVRGVMAIVEDVVNGVMDNMLSIDEPFMAAGLDPARGMLIG
jgi:hypothetical protein